MRRIRSKLLVAAAFALLAAGSSPAQVTPADEAPCQAAFIHYSEFSDTSIELAAHVDDLRIKLLRLREGIKGQQIVIAGGGSAEAKAYLVKLEKELAETNRSYAEARNNYSEIKARAQRLMEALVACYQKAASPQPRPGLQPSAAAPPPATAVASPAESTTNTTPTTQAAPPAEGLLNPNQTPTVNPQAIPLTPDQMEKELAAVDTLDTSDPTLWTKPPSRVAPPRTSAPAAGEQIVPPMGAPVPPKGFAGIPGTAPPTSTADSCARYRAQLATLPGALQNRLGLLDREAEGDPQFVSSGRYQAQANALRARIRELEGEIKFQLFTHECDKQPPQDAGRTASLTPGSPDTPPSQPPSGAGGAPSGAGAAPQPSDPGYQGPLAQPAGTNDCGTLREKLAEWEGRAASSAAVVKQHQQQLADVRRRNHQLEAKIGTGGDRNSVTSFADDHRRGVAQIKDLEFRIQSSSQLVDDFKTYAAGARIAMQTIPDCDPASPGARSPRQRDAAADMPPADNMPPLVIPDLPAEILDLIRKLRATDPTAADNMERRLRERNREEAIERRRREAAEEQKKRKAAEQQKRREASLNPAAPIRPPASTTPAPAPASVSPASTPASGKPGRLASFQPGGGHACPAGQTAWTCQYSAGGGGFGAGCWTAEEAKAEIASYEQKTKSKCSPQPTQVLKSAVAPALLPPPTLPSPALLSPPVLLPPPQLAATPHVVPHTPPQPPPVHTVPVPPKQKKQAKQPRRKQQQQVDQAQAEQNAAAAAAAIAIFGGIAAGIAAGSQRGPTHQQPSGHAPAPARSGH